MKLAIVPEYELDVRGEKCPYPLIRTKQEVEKLPTGAVLEVIANDPEAWQNIDVWITKSGHEFIDVVIRKGVYHIFLRKN